MAEPRKWTVMQCEIGNDLVHRRCHMAVRCGMAGGCNDEAHYCACPTFLVVEVLPTAPTSKMQPPESGPVGG
jgi:hypothetical protein